jgi:class 3 adenylate cyclase/tetratricopeptide (TPR) repeat protein
VKCAKCGADNREGRKFCSKCGSALARSCSNCGAANEPTDDFCGECGTSLSPSPAASSEPAKVVESAIRIASESPSESLDGERKTVTALFADIKGSMELMEDLDPEEARAIVDPALKLMIDAARRYDGYIVQSTGDGIFALFGAPVAHEDHPQRALYAAMRMQDEMHRVAERLRAEKGINLQVRIGANVGEVVVRSIATGEDQVEYTPIGHSISLASRLQVLANPGSIAISDGLRKLVEGYFTLKALGPARIKGSTEPVNVYEVTGLGSLRTRLQRAAGRGLTKFVGRESEIEALRHAAMLAESGRGQLVAVIAEPGVGKSRLYHEFKLKSQSSWMVLEALSVSHGKASPYLPVIELLNSYFGIEPRDDRRKRREKVNGRIVTLDPTLEDTRSNIFRLLGLVEDDDPIAEISPQTRRRRTLDAFKRILLRESLNQPLMMIFEDLHWIDEETQALLNVLVEGIANARVLMLVNYRPEYAHQWGSKTYYTQLRLDPLGNESADQMLSTLLGNGTSLLPLKQLIAEKTEGNPLFIEEIVLNLFEDGALARDGEVKLAKPLSLLGIPATVQAILAARIDRLPADQKNLLQTVAVIGMEFNLRVTRAVSSNSDDELNRMLSNLQLAEFIYEQPAAGDVEYSFKHALTRDVAYKSLLTERRRLLHGRTARAIEELFGERLQDHLSELAHHFDLGGNIPKAVEYLSCSGQKAAEQGAHSEALSCFTRALELLSQLAEGATRDRHELDLQMALSWSLFVARGELPELERALLRACELSERLGESSKMMESFLALAHYRRLNFGLARQLALRVIAMAEQTTAPVMLAGAHFVLGLVEFATGRFLLAREHLERALDLSGAGPTRNFAAYFTQGAAYVLPAVKLNLGYLSAARAKARELLATARESADPYWLATALFLDGLEHLMLRDTSMVARRADEIFSIASELEMPLNFIAAGYFRGWAIAATGHGEEGIAEMLRSISDPRFAKAMGRAMLRAVLAETYGKYARVQEGLDLVAEGLATAEQTGQRAHDSELHRIKGELIMIKDRGNVAEAERCLRIAIEVARGQGAKLFELRATVSLARLLQDTDRREEGRAMLTGIYSWFTEGFDTADLKNAKALLEELT